MMIGVNANKRPQIMALKKDPVTESLKIKTIRNISARKLMN